MRCQRQVRVDTQPIRFARRPGSDRPCVVMHVVERERTEGFGNQFSSVCSARQACGTQITRQQRASERRVALCGAEGNRYARRHALFPLRH